MKLTGARPGKAATAILLTMTGCPAAADDWLVLSGASYHFQQDRRDWRQFNPGIGLEGSTAYPDLNLVAGYFYNSYRRHTVYAGVRWMPWRLGELRLGAFALAASGYDSPVLLLPALSYDLGRFGLNVTAVPNLPGFSGFVGVQFRVRVDR